MRANSVVGRHRVDDDRAVAPDWRQPPPRDRRRLVRWARGTPHPPQRLGTQQLLRPSGDPLVSGPPEPEAVAYGPGKTPRSVSTRAASPVKTGVCPESSRP